MMELELRKEVEALIAERIQQIHGDQLAELIRSVQALAEGQRRLELAQARADERFGELAEGQRRLELAQAQTEQRFGELAEGQRRLEEAQARTEDALQRLAATMEERFGRLEEAQARTEDALQRLAASSEERFGQLEAAQAKTDETLRLGFEGMREMFGQRVEQIAQEIVPHYLKHEEGIEVEPLEQQFFRLSGTEREIELCGTGRRDGEDLLVICDAKTTADIRDVETLERTGREIAAATGRRVLPVIFPTRFSRRARLRAQELGVVVVPWQYQHRV